MKYISFIFAIVLCFVAIIKVSASSFEQTTDLRGVLDIFIVNLREISEIKPEDYKGVEEYAMKLVRSYEKKHLSSKRSSGSDLKETLEKYSKKISKAIQQLDCAPEIIVVISEASESFLKEASQIIEISESSESHLKGSSAVVGADRNEPAMSTPNSNFIEKLKLSEMPNGSLASDYVALWETLENLKNADISGIDSLTAMDLAVHEFSNSFVESFSHQFARESSDQMIDDCLLKGIRHNYNGIVGAIKVKISSKMIEFEERR